jgi:hypothetical protein
VGLIFIKPQCWSEMCCCAKQSTCYHMPIIFPAVDQRKQPCITGLRSVDAHTQITRAHATECCTRQTKTKHSNEYAIDLDRHPPINGTSSNLDASRKDDALRSTGTSWTSLWASNPLTPRLSEMAGNTRRGSLNVTFTTPLRLCVRACVRVRMGWCVRDCGHVGGRGGVCG